MSFIAAVGQVLRVERDAVLLEEGLEFVQKDFIQRGGAAERQRQAVADDGGALSQRPKRLAFCTPDAHPVFRRDLIEVDDIGTSG